MCVFISQPVHPLIRWLRSLLCGCVAAKIERILFKTPSLRRSKLLGDGRHLLSLLLTYKIDTHGIRLFLLISYEAIFI